MSAADQLGNSRSSGLTSRHGAVPPVAVPPRPRLAGETPQSCSVTTHSVSQTPAPIFDVTTDKQHNIRTDTGKYRQTDRESGWVAARETAGFSHPPMSEPEKRPKRLQSGDRRSRSQTFWREGRLTDKQTRLTDKQT